MKPTVDRHRTGQAQQNGFVENRFAARARETAMPSGLRCDLSPR